MKSLESVRNEFLASIHNIIKQFAYDDLMKLHEVIYVEICKRKKEIEATKEIITEA